MGLDMYAYRVKQENAISDFEIATDSEDNRLIEDRDFAYWRKFNALHGWMQRLYHDKGGTGDFNCVVVRLTEEDLDQLAADARAGFLTPTPGFFFGAQTLEPEDLEEVYAFVGKALGAIKAGDAVYYDSWW
jgi:hypothetical protein